MKLIKLCLAYIYAIVVYFALMFGYCLYRNLDRRDRSVEFYNFLPVNTDSNGSEVIDHQRKDEVEVEQEATEQQGRENTIPFIDFLSAN